jgi:hypothetical protein
VAPEEAGPAVLFFLLQGLFKNIFSLEPHMKLATFVVGSFCHNNKKEKCYKIVPRRRNHRCRKKSIKTANFFQIHIIHT